MYRFWGKPKAEKMQRKVFIVRAVCPEWMIWYHSERAREIAKEQQLELLPLDIREDIDHLANNIAMQMPPGKVRLVSDGSKYNDLTMLAIAQKLVGNDIETYEPPLLAEFFLPAKSLKLSKWLDRFLYAWQNTTGNIVVVVNQGTFDRWYSQLHMQEKPHSEPCIMISNGSKGLLSVA